jgi:hypothetical protein
LNSMVCPQGWTLLYCLEKWRDKQRIPPPRDNFIPRGQNSLLGDQLRPLGLKFAPRGEAKYGPRFAPLFL